MRIDGRDPHCGDYNCSLALSGFRDRHKSPASWGGDEDWRKEEPGGGRLADGEPLRNLIATARSAAPAKATPPHHGAVSLHWSPLPSRSTAKAHLGVLRCRGPLHGAVSH
ncbi:Os03g0829750 [Oryza sativa Japonica Group]|uniref:Uncharacterized protein n=2 Tax=Oryza sativa subsp. japonica TaxID=39947 RepID=B9F739_ORYSJ|nr:hypothetical protein [Oryza sativa Japonica Group]AAP46252.1 hypothetical protein [Oryza sativa Japonica Group]EEE60227.1 hypothetical protein OsJ_13215 [Oryza sativa Japonica Group]BAS87188.1 Os03g0829750 [Oryza sativa Japonica Group]